MKFPVSILIMCKNAAATIGPTLRSVEGLCAETVVYDTGSTDDTEAVARAFDVQWHQGPWLGFGPTRQKAMALARHPWVLVIDADEVVTDALRHELEALEPPEEKRAFRFLLQQYLHTKRLRWGLWRRDYRVRLFHRSVAQWSHHLVHEKLVVQPGVRLATFENPLLHFTAFSLDAFAQKMDFYAGLAAEQYRLEGRKATWVKQHLSPLFSFAQNYLLRLGFLDGKAGYQMARLFQRYTAEKYKRLAAR